MFAFRYLHPSHITPVYSLLIILYKMSMASSDISMGLGRTPLKEEGDVTFILKLGCAVQPRGVMFKGTSILVGERLKTLL